ncbi:MAG TPA: hypothetical protein DIS95_03620 [Proteus vulgaris]|uniref:hypothetical protein n=1 Tax=Proteus terrae TaxID=1574161 RepID=UPI000EEFAC52|nr:hypothetical protein [Proteus terrae]MCT8262515.1 hypothetical protein [Proteus terrae]HCN41489.1 hypothetical protein [Proteus vulgaris]
MSYKTHGDFINDIITRASEKVRGYCGGMFVNMVYNHQGSIISVIWSNFNTSVSEIYNFNVMSDDQFYAILNDGRGGDLTRLADNKVIEIYHFMVKIESIQSERPPAISI